MSSYSTRIPAELGLESRSGSGSTFTLCFGMVRGEWGGCGEGVWRGCVGKGAVWREPSGEGGKGARERGRALWRAVSTLEAGEYYGEGIEYYGEGAERSGEGEEHFGEL